MLISILIATFSQTLKGQITAVEYYFDIDPGFGNGIAVDVGNVQVLDTIFQIDVSGLTPGHHRLYIRMQDATGRWSQVYDQLIFRNPDPADNANLPSVVESEYFFDTDPGFGHGTQVVHSANPMIVDSFPADLTSQTPGFHRLFFRTKDENGRWSQTFSHKIFRNPDPSINGIRPDIVAFEYFLDSDPGYGNATLFPSDSIPDVLEIFATDITMLTAGPHQLYIRVKDQEQRWSQTLMHTVYLLEIKAFLEGAYDTVLNEMIPALNAQGKLPLHHPYSQNTGAPWFYDGQEQVVQIPSVSIVDWIVVQTRDAVQVSGAGSMTVKETQACFIHSDGSVTAVDGSSLPVFTERIDNNLFIVVWHRNHIGIISANPVQQSGSDAWTYDMSSDADAVFGGSTAHKKLMNGVWGMAGGDGNGDQQINNADKNNIWEAQAGSGEYLPGDFNMDGQVNNADKNDIWVPNTGAGGQVPGKGN